MKKLHILALATVTLLVTPVATFAYHWTSACSAGATIDEADLSQYQVDKSSLFFASGETGIILARYNVTNTTGDDTPPYTTFELGYTDTSTLGSVTAFLYEVDPCTGLRVEICRVVSIDNTTCNTCTFPNTTFNFATNLYFVTVQLSRTSTAANPMANTLRIY